MKRVLSLALVLVMVLTLLPISVFADTVASGTCGDNLTWTLDSEGTLTISGTGRTNSYDENYRQPWYSHRDLVKNVVINSGVTGIGEYAFRYCHNLASVTIPDSVTSISDFAFEDCSSLKSVTIGNGVTSIGNEAFRGCSSLTEINYNAKDASVSYGSNVFYDAGTAGDGIKVTFGDSVEKIPAYLFDTSNSSYSPKITSVTIGNSVTSIGERAFYNCSNLTEINYNAKAVADLSNNSYVFYNAGTAGDGIKVTFGENVKRIPACLFYSTIKVREMDFCGNAPGIGGNAFYGVATTAYYLYGNDTWTSEVMKNYGGRITWKPYSNTEATSVICTGNKCYIVGDKLDTSSISVTINRVDGCVEVYNYSTGKIVLGEYDMSKIGEQSIPVTCRGEKTQLDIYVHNINTETMPAKDYPESSHNYENNLDKTYTYVADGARSLDVTFSSETETELNVDYIYVNDTKYTGKELAGANIHIDGDTLAIRLVSDGSDGAYGFSLDNITATYVVHSFTDTVTAPTCTEKGYTTHTCVCGYVYNDSYVDALGHSFGEWIVTTAPTCTEKGVETRYCSRCDATETREVNALGHALVHHDGKAAACTEKGWEAYDTCSRCDYTTYKEISALGHDYKDGVCTRCGAKDPDYKPPVKENPFVDVSESSVYYDAILWAYYHEPQQITGGFDATHFVPGNACTRAQVVTFLWRAAGCPEPAGDTSIFKDAESIAAPFQKAVAWAVEKGITAGYNDGTFRPNDPVTRAQFVTFLWRYENKPATTGSIAGFADASSIAAPYQQAVAWAVEKGITTGYNDGTFRPNATCTRWAVVLFMYRDMA